MELWETDQDPRKGAATDDRIVPWPSEKQSEKPYRQLLNKLFSDLEATKTKVEEAVGKREKERE